MATTSPSIPSHESAGGPATTVPSPSLANPGPTPPRGPTSRQFDEAQRVFLRAIQAPPAERQGCLLGWCGGDAVVANLVQELLAGDETAHPALDAPERAFQLSDPDGQATDAERAAQLPGHLGPYRVLGLLGRGRWGLVLRAVQPHVDREVALKVVCEPGRSAREERDGFAREVAALSRLQHPGIAQVFGVEMLAWSDGVERPAIVMELVKGEAITSALRAAGPVAKVQAIALVCEAVAHAHQRGVLHRDLKPAHILLEPAEGPRQHHPRVIDFGIARLLDQGHGDRTMAGHVAGTLAYMAPEQTQGGVGDTRCDVYAIGAVLYELLAGRPLVDVGGCSVLEAVRQVQRCQPAPLGLGATFTRGADLEAVVRKAVARDPRDRYPTVDALREDLGRWLEGAPVRARPLGPIASAVRAARRNPLITAGITAALLGLVGVTIVLAASRAHVQQADAEAREAAALLLNEVAERLAGRVGAAADRKAILERLMPSVERLAARRPDDLPLQRDFAKLLGALADALQEEDRNRESLDLCRRALELRLRLSAANPNDLHAVADVSIARVRLGDLLGETGDREGQRRAYDDALRIDLELMALRPEERQFQANLIFSYERLAGMAVGDNRLADARTLSERQLAGAEALKRAFGASVANLWILASAQGETANILSRLGEHEPAMKLWLAQVALLEDIVAQEPSSRMYRLRLASARLGASELTFLTRNPELAHDWIRRAVAEGEALLAADPRETNVMIFVSRAQNMLSRRHLAQGDNDAALAAAHRSLAVARELARFCGDCPEGLSYALAAQGWLSQTLDTLGLAREAAQSRLDSVDLTRRWARSGRAADQLPLAFAIADVAGASPELLAEALDAVGRSGDASLTAVDLRAGLLVRQGRIEDAWATVDRAEQTLRADDADGRAAVRRLRERLPPRRAGNGAGQVPSGKPD